MARLFYRLIFGWGLIVSMATAWSYMPDARAAEPAWADYRQKFVSQDGRVIDFGQEQSSHSEGQGYAMLLAVMNDDRPTFENIYKWTRDNLALRKDKLHSWRWGKRHDGLWDVIDYNNATDGDLLIAWAMTMGAQKWQNPEFNKTAAAIAGSVRKFLTASWQGKKFLVPGYFGFVNNDDIVLNPSYGVFPALTALASVDDKQFWDNMHADMLFLLEKSLSGQMGLPADWVLANKWGISPFAAKSPHFGDEAIRTILYISFEGGKRFPDGVGRVFDQYVKLGYLPHYFDIISDEVSLRDAPGGYYAVFGAAAQQQGKKDLAAKLFETAKRKVASENNNYYSYSLYLLALEAAKK